MSRMSAITGTNSTPVCFLRSSFRISKIGFSPWPSSSTLLGPSAASWRQSSLPMEPPAPVTSTVWSWASLATRLRSVRMGSRRSRSWISTLRRFVTPTLPLMISPREGTVRVLTPQASAACTTARTTVPGAVGMAITTSVTFWRRMMSGIWASVPTIGTLPTRSPCLDGSSSANATGSMPRALFVVSSRKIIWPAVPAPAISTRCDEFSSPRRMECHPPMRMSRRGAASNTTLSTLLLNSTDSGTREVMRSNAGSTETPSTAAATEPATPATTMSSSSAMLA